MYTDDKVLVYIGYPAEVVSRPPQWIDSVVREEVQDPNKSVFRFYLSGGSVTTQLLSLLKDRAEVLVGAQKMAMKLVQGYTSRLVDPLLSPNIEKLVALTRDNALSTEYRILLDLWVLSRSDVYVVDCDLLGRARSGMEAVYAQDCVRTVGVSDSPILDPWFQYHLDVIVKSQMCFQYLESLRHSILAGRRSSIGASKSEEVST